MYLYSLELSDKANKKLEKKNIAFTKDGMKVGVKEVRDEDYADRTQKYVSLHNCFLHSALLYHSESEGVKKMGMAEGIPIYGLTSRVRIVCWSRRGI